MRSSRTRALLISAVIGAAASGCAAGDPTPHDKDGEVTGDIAAEGLKIGKADSPFDLYQGVISFDERKDARLPYGVAYHFYTLDVTGPSDAFVDLASRFGDDTFLALYRREQGRWQFVDQNDDCLGSTNSCLRLTLDAGNWAVLATTYDYVRYGVRGGADYELEVFCDSGACAVSEPQICGTRGASACPSGSYCDFPDDLCGAADGPGVCQPMPEVCTEQYDPVCGCGDQTFSNECEAAAAGVDVAYRGICAGTEGAACGGAAGVPCNPGFYCDLSANETCRAAMGGTCAAIPTEPQHCTLEFMPVCGCDGQVYNNHCLRRRAGAAFDDTGSCLPQ